MPKIKTLVLLCLITLFVASSASAGTYAVGSCLPNLPSFPTISLAVGTAPAGSIIRICPGTYPEQILINRSLNLQGVSSGNSDQPIITVPQASPSGGPGLVPNVVSQDTITFLGGNFPFAAQILVQTTTPVFISGITIDGSGGSMSCTAAPYIWLAGIFYASGSSGTINHVTTRNQFDQGCGTGIWVENATTPFLNVTIQNSSVHDFDFAGIFLGTPGMDSWLNATVRNNHVNQGVGKGVNNPTTGIFSAFIAGNVVGNVVTGSDTCIANLSSAPLTTVLNNNVADCGTGISSGYDGGTVFHNQISNSSTGIDLQSNNVSATGNSVMNTNIGIEFECNTGTVHSNLINDAKTALDKVPFGFALLDHYYNIDTVSNQCPFGGAKTKHINLPGRN